MLKIKDNVDLKELEKFGFQKGYKMFCINNEPRIIMAVVDDKRNLSIQYSDSAWWDMNYWYLYDENQDKIYDLIQAGLVEKVDG
jgi:hypothetical protein